MAFRLERSATTFIDPTPLDIDKKYRMGIYVRELNDSTAPLRHFGEVYGDTLEVCSMRAELLCIAVNKTTNPTQEYSTNGKEEQRTNRAEGDRYPQPHDG